MRMILPAAAILLALSGGAMAQGDPRGGRDPYLAGTGGAARDGCINIPTVPHNSADCSRIPVSDLNTVVNRESSDLDGRPTGATENAMRNRQILDEMRRAGRP
jgi:hypothetical protein